MNDQDDKKQDEANFADELQEFIDESALSKEDKAFWKKALINATPDIAISILSYFQDFPDKVQWMTDIFKKKVQAFKSKDENAWSKILAEEESELERIATN